ncbi:hypothetical protein ACLB2K_047002 [Fragaria x ananassa]
MRSPPLRCRRAPILHPTTTVNATTSDPPPPPQPTRTLTSSTQSEPPSPNPNLLHPIRASSTASYTHHRLLDTTTPADLNPKGTRPTASLSLSLSLSFSPSPSPVPPPKPKLHLSSSVVFGRLVS